jgi:hypothetical protein
MALIEGRVSYILWPLSRFGSVSSELPQAHTPRIGRDSDRLTRR